MRALAAKTSVALIAAVLLLSSSRAGAHTESDLVAVAAGEDATLTLKPTHGCDGSPTVEVAIQAPVTGAVAAEVEGWTATATDDLEAGTTVLEWTGGSLPADVEGEFPVQFTVPDNVGELLVFPAIQVCEDGAELAWIDGDPEGEYPAPRILVLPAGTPSASSMDDVPADAPGRDQLTTIVDVDNPVAEADADGTSTTVDTGDDVTETTVSNSEGESAQEATDAPNVGDTETEAEPEDQGDEIGLALIIAIVAVVAIGGGAAYAFSRRRTA